MSKETNEIGNAAWTAKWRLLDSECGELRYVHKSLLKADHDYQRGLKKDKALAIAREWSWTACGVLVVADRGGELWCVDGQHRLAAAMKRSDVRELPCIIFRSSDKVAEAATFVRIQKNRKPITALEVHKAKLVAKDPIALKAQEAVERIGREVGNKTGPETVRCIALFYRLLAENETAFLRVLPLAAQLCEGQPMYEQIVHALFYIETHLTGGQSVSDGKWRARILSIGAVELLDAIRKASAFYATGGSKVWASGVVNRVNKGLQNKLEVGE